MIATVTLNPSLDEWVRLPSLRVGALNRGMSRGRYPGGKGINVSRVVHELGGRTVAYALAGGHDGLILREVLNRLAIVHAFVEVEGATRNNYKIQTDSPRTLTEINTAGPTVTQAALRALKQRVLHRRPRPACVVLSGSLPPGAPLDTYRQWVRTLQQQNIPSVLDASGDAFRRGLQEHPWLIKPNRLEAEELLGRRLRRLQDLLDAARHLLRQGPTIVILSLGAEGALMACKQPAGVWMAWSPSVKSDSAVGAGDSLIGGFLVGLARHTLPEAFRIGVACGTATAMSPGTELCHARDVRRLLRRVTVRRLA